MPNQRSDDKEYLSAWIDSDLKAKLKALSKERGCSMSDLIAEAMRIAITKRGKGIDEE